MSEQWRPIAGYEGYYEVSDRGGVRSLDHFVANRNPTSRTFVRGRALRPSVDKIGRPYVRLSRKNVHDRRNVSRLVLEAFVGPCPEGMEGCHDDGDPGNNRVANLRWDTRTNNIYDCIRHGRHHNASKTHCPQGHEYTSENTVFNKKTAGRACRLCRDKRCREYYLRKKASA